MSTTTCPVFYLDVDDMQNLVGFVENIEVTHPDIGICKLIPPRGWYQRSYDTKSLELPRITPIKQVVAGRSGAFHVTAFERNAMSLTSFQYHASQHSDKHTSSGDKEREFWRSMGRPQAPLYGADLEGSLFDSSVSSSKLGMHQWSFETGLKDLLRMLPYKVPGVNTAMLYVGEWRAMFPFHVEDLDLYSINYLHTGAAKSWYSIAPSRRGRFENLAESHFADDQQQCKEYMRHKTKIFSPIKLRECGMKFDTVVQQAGEFVVTFPGAYHGGFNHDFNIAEATNFATQRWLELGRKATRCVCRPHSVYINIDELETLYRRSCLKAKAIKKEHSHSKSQSTLPTIPSIGVYGTKSNVVDLTADTSRHSADRTMGLSEHPVLRCECGEVRSVQLHERADLITSSAPQAVPKLIAHCHRTTFLPPSQPSCLLRCSKCLYYVHRHCARTSTDSDYACYMCRRIDEYSTADTVMAVAAPSEPSGQRTSSLKALQFSSTSKSSPVRIRDDDALYFIDRTPSPELVATQKSTEVPPFSSTHTDEMKRPAKKSVHHKTGKHCAHKHLEKRQQTSVTHGTKKNHSEHKGGDNKRSNISAVREAARIDFAAAGRHAEITRRRKEQQDIPRKVQYFVCFCMSLA